MNIFETYYVSWKTQNPYATEDDVTNGIREALARDGNQVGDCFVIERTHTEGMASIETETALGPGDTFRWKDITAVVESEIA